MTNVLKKIETGNPLGYFGLMDELEQYVNINNDEDHVSFLHRMLDKSEDRPLVRQSIWAMIAYATGLNINADALLECDNNGQEMKIELINGKWTVNGKEYHELDPAERIYLDDFFKSYRKQLK